MKRDFLSKNPLTPREIVAELDRYIVGQERAKRVVAVALRNRWRRIRLDPSVRKEIYPKNILMVGPTGVGKTEIARRLATIAGAPFVKVEATRYTEVGYVGRDVEGIIRDLSQEGLRMVQEHLKRGVANKARERAVRKVLELLNPAMIEPGSTLDPETLYRELSGDAYAARKIRIEVEGPPPVGIGVMGLPPFAGELEENIREMMSRFFPRERKPVEMTVPEALRYYEEQFANELIDEEKARRLAQELVENEGIVFIDEVDKIARSSRITGATPDVSGEGVQRDLLPIVEGTTVSTRIGPIKTDYILFIAAGAFHTVKPRDLIPEFQGRFPLRVELDSLTRADFVRILTEPEHSLIKQAELLLKTEGVTLRFEPEALEKIADIAYTLNQKMEDIGARRLHTVLEYLLEEVSFSAPEISGTTVPITPSYVEERLQSLYEERDLTRFIL